MNYLFRNLVCGPLKCPANATSCVYTEATTPDLKFIERNSTCSANNGNDEMLFSFLQLLTNFFSSTFRRGCLL